MSEIRAESGQTIFDLALLAYGDASKAYNLIAENPLLIENINSDLQGLTLTYTPSTIPSKEAVKIKGTVKRNVTIQSTQNLFDLSLQYYGSAEKVYDLLSQNPLIVSLLDTEYVGRTLNYNLSNELAPRYYRDNKIDVSTGGIVFINEVGINFLLQENGFFLLQETGDKIEL